MLKTRKTIITVLTIPLVLCFAASLIRPALAQQTVDTDAVESGFFSETKQPPELKSLKVIAFNIEFGRGFDEILEYLRSQVPQNPGTGIVILLSEVDRDMERTGDRNIGRELAQALKMNYFYGVEFVELGDLTPERLGVTGNAILTPLPLSNPRLIRHTLAYDWSKVDFFKTNTQPREGGRSAILGDVSVGKDRFVRVASLHLENRSEPKPRSVQMQEVLDAVQDSKSPVVLGGDLNEMRGRPLFDAAATAGFANAFEKDDTRTGNCTCNSDPPGPVCTLKIDWILFRDLKLVSSGVSPACNDQNRLLSDHAPIWAEFSFY